MTDPACDPTATVTHEAANDVAHDVPMREDITLKDVSLDRNWRTSPFAKQVIDTLTGYRAVGLVEGTCPEGSVAGVLIRHARHKHYRLAGHFGLVGLPTEPTEHFLQTVRSGHHGGPGRCQGGFAADGSSYTKRCNVSITTEIVELAAGKGDGAFSLGLRRLAAQVSRRMTERFGRIDDLSVLVERVDTRTGTDGTPVRIAAYLDADSMTLFRALGGGMLSRGVRYAAWVDGHRLR